MYTLTLVTALVAFFQCIRIYNSLIECIMCLYTRSRNQNGKMKMMKIKNPEPDQIRAARLSAELTQESASRLVYSSLNAWSQWERGERKMHPAIWELFQIKTQQLIDINGI